MSAAPSGPCGPPARTALCRSRPTMVGLRLSAAGPRCRRRARSGRTGHVGAAEPGEVDHRDVMLRAGFGRVCRYLKCESPRTTVRPRPSRSTPLGTCTSTNFRRSTNVRTARSTPPTCAPDHAALVPRPLPTPASSGAWRVRLRWALGRHASPPPWSLTLGLGSVVKHRVWRTRLHPPNPLRCRHGSSPGRPQAARAASPLRPTFESRLRGRGALVIDQRAAARPAAPNSSPVARSPGVLQVARGRRALWSVAGVGAGRPELPPGPRPECLVDQMEDNLFEWLVRLDPGLPRRAAALGVWSTGAPRAIGADLLMSVATARRRDP